MLKRSMPRKSGRSQSKVHSKDKIEPRFKAHDFVKIAEVERSRKNILSKRVRMALLVSFGLFI